MGKGMLYGNYQRNSEGASAIWKFWDEYSIEKSTMIGYWESDAAVKLIWDNNDNYGNGNLLHTMNYTGYEKILDYCETKIVATSYVIYKVQAIVVISSWCKVPKNVRLELNLEEFGMNGKTISVQQIELGNGIQQAKDL